MQDPSCSTQRAQCEEEESWPDQWLEQTEFLYLDLLSYEYAYSIYSKLFNVSRNW